MPALKNPRHEAFVQAHTEGLPAYKAYLRAGYKCSDRVAMVESSKLLRKPDIRGRRRELLDQLAETMLVTRESLAAEYDQAIALAHEMGQPAAAATAIAAKQKLLGMDPASKSISLNLTFSDRTDDELGFELASMINEVRGAAGKAPLALPPKKDGTEH